MKNWISMLLVVAVTLAVAGCDDAKETNSEGGDEKNVRQQDSQQQDSRQKDSQQKDSQPKVANPKDARPKDEAQKRSPESKSPPAGGVQDENENATAPKSKIFSSIGRAFLKGTSGGDSEEDPTDQSGEGNRDKGN